MARVPESDATLRASKKPKSGVLTADRMVKLAVLLGVALVGLVLVAGWFTFVKPFNPRTQEEQGVMTLEGIAKQKPKSGKLQAEYISALVTAHQYTLARQVIDAAVKVVDNKAIVLTEEGYLLYSQNKKDEALKKIDQALGVANGKRNQELKRLAAKGIRLSKADAALPEVLRGALIKAQIYKERKDYKNLVAAFSTALDENPRMSDILVDRGDAYAALGQKDKARADYKLALKYAPQYKPALDALKKIGADSK